MKYVTLTELVEAEYSTDTMALLEQASPQSLADIANILPSVIAESNKARNYLLNGKLDVIKRQLESVTNTEPWNVK